MFLVKNTGFIFINLLQINQCYNKCERRIEKVRETNVYSIKSSVSLDP